MRRGSRGHISRESVPKTVALPRVGPMCPINGIPKRQSALLSRVSTDHFCSSRKRLASCLGGTSYDFSVSQALAYSDAISSESVLTAIRCVEGSGSINSADRETDLKGQARDRQDVCYAREDS
jgi:hypothetical protein